ncbi:MAG TPA: hypothetical protein VJ438_06075, partial [Candidatus Nanoarchaeia archaeon]|nr:hypothetical protein [Candidatus Nanoarchaeia archaeon]
MIIHYFEKKRKNSIKLNILILLTLFLLPFISAADLVLDFNYPQQAITQTVTVNTGNATGTSNSSDFWDSLDTPADILGSQINNDLGWITSAGAEPLWNGNFSTVAKIGDCPAGQFVQNTTTSGVQCAVASGSGDITSVQGDDIYIYNGSTSGDVVLVLNETKLNNTIDSRASSSETNWNANYSTFLTHINWATASNGTLAFLSTILGFNYYNSTNFPYTHLSNFTNDGVFITNATMNKTVSCSNIIGSPDSDFCTDDSGSGGGANVSTTTCTGTDKVSAIDNS